MYISHLVNYEIASLGSTGQVSINISTLLRSEGTLLCTFLWSQHFVLEYMKYKELKTVLFEIYA